MNLAASAFVLRARFFLSELRAGKYPNATTLQKFDRCSRATAARFITRLETEYLFPIAFEPSKRGYFLTNKDFTFEFLPPGKDELCALFLLCQLADTIGAVDLKLAINSLWNSATSTTAIHAHDLKLLNKHFSADVTAVATLADTGVLELVNAAATGTPVEINYKSPWRHDEVRQYTGYIERVHLSDGTVYVLLRSSDGRQLVLNAAFLKGIKLLTEPPKMKASTDSDQDLSWLDGFGVWASEEIIDVEVHIAAPGAEFYAAQKWHAEQIDIWQDNTLIRKFPSMLSPELVRRILSLGRYVVRVEPAELRQMVRSEVENLAANLK